MPTKKFGAKYNTGFTGSQAAATAKRRREVMGSLKQDKAKTGKASKLSPPTKTRVRSY